MGALWALSSGTTTTNESAEAIGSDPSGNVYVAGNFSATIDFDPGPGVTNLGTGGARDIFIAKYTSLGAFVWVKRISGAANQVVYKMVVDATGIYITGTYDGLTDFDPSAATFNVNTIGGIDSFFAKYDLNGNLLWVDAVRSTSTDKVAGLFVDASQNVYITGSIGANTDMDPSAASLVLAPTGLPNAYFAKYNSTGGLIFANLISGNFSEGTDISADLSGNVYVTGSFTNSCDFDPSAASASLTTNPTNISDIFLAKYDASGNFVFAKKIGGPGGDIAYQVATDISGNVFLGGSYSNACDFDPDAATYTISATGFDFFVAKYTSSGNLVWVNGFGSSSSVDACYGLDLDAIGNVYITGSTFGFVDFDPGPASFILNCTGYSVFLAEYTNNGALIYAGTPNVLSQGNDLVVNSSIYLAGSFNNTGDFDFSPATNTLSSNGARDIFFAKYNLCTGPYPAQPSAISGNSIVCVNTAAVYSVTSDPTAVNYFWDVSPSLNWSGSSLTNTISLTPTWYGSVTVHVVASNTCGLGPYNSMIVDVGGFYASNITTTAVSCFSGTNGAAAISVAGGIPPITYSWTPSAQTTSLISNVASGSNTVIASDAFGCSVQEIAIISQPSLLTLINPTVGNIVCYGTNTGTVGATPNGGTPGYFYSWLSSTSVTPAPFNMVTNVPAGNYSLNVTDSKGCSATMAFTVTQSSNSTSVVSTATNAACNLAAVGSATVIFNGGTPPYTYSWTPSSQTTNILAGVNVGNYSITCIDALGCIKKQSITIPFAQTPTILVSPASSSICSNQTLTLNVNGATSYTWSTNAVANTITVNPGVTVVYTVTGENNTCFNTKTATVNVTPSPTILISMSSVSVCAGISTTLSASGANSYTWNNTSSNATLIVVNPTNNTTYTLTGEANNCIDTNSVFLNVFPLPNVTAATSDTILCVGQTATLTASGAITYTWSDNSSTNPIIVAPSSDITYTVTGTDVNGCLNTSIITQSVSICTGINTVFIENPIEVYPNPFTNELHLKSATVKSIFIYNMLGQLILRINSSEKNYKINTQDYPSGVYFIRSENSNTIKLIKH